MTERRRDFSKDAKIAALSSIVFGIPHDDQKKMHELHVHSLLEWHHNDVDRANNHFSNAVPMLKAAHREQTAKVDVPAIAKGKRIQRRELLRSYNEAAKVDADTAAALFPAVARFKGRKQKIANRGFGKRHRPLRGRNTFQRRQ